MRTDSELNEGDITVIVILHFAQVKLIKNLLNEQGQIVVIVPTSDGFQRKIITVIIFSL